MYNSALPLEPGLPRRSLLLSVLATQLLLDLKRCNSALLDDLDFVRRSLTEAAVEAGATVVGESFHKFDPVGVTGVIAIAESHISVHTWPEYGFATVDILTCGPNVMPRRAAELIIRSFECEEPSVTELDRGTVPELSATVPR